MRFPLRASLSRRRHRATGEAGQFTSLFFPQANVEMQAAEPPPQIPPTVELPNIGTWGNGQQAIGDGTVGGQPGNGTGNGTGNNTPGNGGSNHAGQSGDEGGQGQGQGQGTGSADGLLANAGNANHLTNGVPVMPLGHPAPAVVTHATANGNNHPELTVTLAEGNTNDAGQPDNAAADTGAEADTPLGKRIRARAYFALRLDQVAAIVLRIRDKVRGQQQTADAANAANVAQPSALANATGTLGVPE